MNKETPDFIFDRSIPEPNSGCWLWLMGISDNGYGKASRNKYQRYAHRVSFATFKCEPGKMHVLHKCDNRMCVNPDHLFLGTQQDNMDDMCKKGRSVRGEYKCNSKLSKKDALYIIGIPKEQISHVDMAKRFGVAFQTIADIRSGRTWKWLAS